MILIFVGPQGSGKGTQAKIIAQKMNIAHISTGDLLRNLQGDLKQKVDEIMHKGNLIPDELIIEIIKKRILNQDCKSGFILDGFPRNIEQAKKLDEKIKVDKIIEISISDEEAIKRLSGRLTCKKCGAGFNSMTAPKPKQKGICDFCGGELYTRDDDNEEAIKKRLKIYHNQTEPILKHYNSIKIDGEQSIEKVTEDIIKELS